MEKLAHRGVSFGINKKEAAVRVPQTILIKLAHGY